MININNKSWDRLDFTDIERQLLLDDDENFFFEYKNDKVSTKKLSEELCAFANTYGGYIFLGIDDDKKISGCEDWTENKIHNVIHNLITPTPIFDVKKFTSLEGLTVLIIKIEEGIEPPYITSEGKIT